MFIAEASEAVILVAEAKDYSFVGVNFTTIPLEGLVFPVGVEFDPRSEIVYWTDAILHTVNRASINGSSQDIIARLQNTTGDRHYPYGIALNLDDDKVYWADQYRGIIEVSNLDGTGRDNLLFVGYNSYPNDTSCPSENLCAPNGTCVIFERQPVLTFLCICDEGYHGAHCELDIDDCAVNPCSNGGSCTDGVNSFTCDCAPGYSGVNCTTDINDCDPNPCINGGTCNDEINFYTCECALGYTDVNCSTDINDCDPNPCMNGGTCNDGINSFTCYCALGYTDINCSTDINDCDPNPCLNGGTCYDGINSFTCYCALGYIDVNCSTDFSPEFCHVHASLKQTAYC
nr:fibropellin-3-like [Lytechinus pictus]